MTPEEPKSEPTTKFVDEEGNEVSPTESGKQGSKVIAGYEFVETTQPTKPARLATSQAPAAQTQANAPVAPTQVKAEVLPNTGTASTATASAVGLGMILASLGLAGKRRKEN